MSGRALLRRAAAVAATVAGAALAVDPAPGVAQEVLTQQEALRLAFPEPARVDRRTAFLDSAALHRAAELAGPGVEVAEPVVTYYVGSRRDTVLGVAYFDAHRVRTLPEVLMVVVTPRGRVDRVEVLTFGEPQEYRPPQGWLGEFRGMSLGERLSTKGDVLVVTGATLTSRAVTRAVRRVLALHEVIAPVAEAEGPGSRGAADAGGREAAAAGGGRRGGRP